MTYSPTYVSADLSAITVDVIGSGMIQFVSFVGLIVLSIIVAFLWNQFRKLGQRVGV